MRKFEAGLICGAAKIFLVIDNPSCLCYYCGNSEKAMKRNSTYTMNFREKMVGANLYFSISKQSRSFGPNNGFP
ncbi:MAG TPA: hypothetical protein DEQ64_19070 [Lachnoclostridium sp.]|nr:hypothetical protein [Lachnoclostridium sp.]